LNWDKLQDTNERQRFGIGDVVILKYIMEKKSMIGVDVGGTKIHIARIELDKVVAELRIPTAANRSRDEIVNDLSSGISQLLTPKVTGIGIGVPGLVDMDSGTIRNVLNIPAWRDMPIREKLENVLGVPVFVGNDANCFALGEKYFGKARHYSNIVALALGTGVGAGVIINNRLYVGNGSLAGEFGGIKYQESEYENYCSGKFFLHNYHIDAKVLAERAASKDKMALDAFTEFGRHVAHLIETILYSVGPDAIIIGGSLSNAFPYFKKGMQDMLSAFPHMQALESTHIDISGNPDIPVLGAGALVLSAKNSLAVIE